jgi:hypothetical protein
MGQGHREGKVMSETKSDHANQNHPPCLPPPALREACSRLVKWAAGFNNNRLNCAEADGMLEGDIAIIRGEELQTLDEMEALLELITDLHGINQIGIGWKQRVLNALTSIQGWDPDSLYALQRSLERDNSEVVTGVYSTSVKPLRGRRWLNRLNFVVAKG